MRNVQRTEAPACLKANSKKWSDALSKRLKKYEDQGKRPPRSCYSFPSSKKHKPEILNSLNDMYSELCCYCEQSAKGAPEIEHLRPCSKYHKHTYDWNNLHLACHACNNAKLDQYDDTNPILDPCEQEPLVETHLRFEICSTPTQIELHANTPRGNTTILHPKLNREDLLTARLKIFAETLKLVQGLRASGNNTAASELAKAKLRKMRNGEHGFPSTVIYALRMAQAEPLLEGTA